MFMRVGVPLLMLLVLALILLAVIAFYARRRRDAKVDARKQAYVEWTGKCQFDNPKTGAKCEREEFHLENHYHDVNGVLQTW